MCEESVMNRWRSVLLTVSLGIVALMTGRPAMAEVLERQSDERAPVATTVDEWLTHIAQADLAEIISITVEEAEGGVTLRLESSGELAVGETSVAGNAAIADIPNAILNLPEGEDFFVSNPADGIALVSVSALPDNQVRIAITGADAPPSANFQITASGLAAAVAVGEATAQT